MNGFHHRDLSESLRLAVEQGHTERVVELLKRGAPSELDDQGQTPLHIAASAGHVELVDVLIQAGFDVTVQDYTGHTALQRAAAEGHLEIVKTLLENGVSVDHQDEVHGNTALHEAAWKGFSQTVQILCKWKANAYIKNRGGFAPLHLCCQNGHNETCRVLLLAGCKPDIKNNYGDTPLHTGARYGHAGVIRILVSADCNPSEQNKNGDTALHIAAAMGRRKLTRVLLESACNKDVKNKQNETALEIAQRKNLHDIMQILQQYQHKSPRPTCGTGNNTATAGNGGIGKYPEKSVDDTTEEEFDVDAIMKDPTYEDSNESFDQQQHRQSNNNPLVKSIKSSQNQNNHHPRNSNPIKSRDRSSSSSKENHHQHHHHQSRRSRRNNKKQKNNLEQDGIEPDMWSPYGYHPQLAELDEMFKRNPRAIKDIMRQLNPGEEFYLDLAGNVRKGPSSRNRNCYCAPVFSKFEKRLEKDKRDLIRHIDQSQMKLDTKIAYLEKKTKEQLFGLNQSMKEAFAAERGECQDRMERRALRERIAIERQQVLRDVALKRELAIWLDAKLTEIERRHNLDAKNAALLRAMAIKRLTKFKKGKTETEGNLRRAHSEELLSEVGVERKTSSEENKSEAAASSSVSGLLQVSDHPRSLCHPRMRHNSADHVADGVDDDDDDQENNNYENFAHELSNPYMWPPMMTNTRDFSNSTSKRNIDLNSTNSDSGSHRSSNEIHHHGASLSVNSRPSNPVSPERRLDLVLGSSSEIQFHEKFNNSSSSNINPITASGVSGGSSGGIQFSDHNPGVQKMARPIPTFNSFGIHHQASATTSGQNGRLPVQDTVGDHTINNEHEHDVNDEGDCGGLGEVHLARPAYAPTPSPGGCSDDTPPPLPSRQQQISPPQTSQNGGQLSQSLPYFPYHQFPGRSVKSMLAPLDENDYSPGEDQADSIGSSQNKSQRSLESHHHGNSDFPSLLNVPLGSDGQASHDSHNDSGYSTRFGYSAGPSPSLSGSRPESSEDDHPQYQNGNPPLLLDPMAIHMMPPEYDRPVHKKTTSMIEKVTNGLSKLHFTNGNIKGSLV